MAEPRPRVKEYTADGVVVSFDAAICIHARRCVHGLPEVFDVAKRPWIQPDGAAADAVIDVVARCPTGALAARRLDGGPEAPVPAGLTVTETVDGPLYVAGEIEVVNEAGQVVRTDTRVALCRCGGTGNPPYCDGTHTENGFSTTT